MTGFLRGRPRSVILHCLDRQSRSNKYHGGDLREGGKEGVFTLQKTDGPSMWWTLAGAHRIHTGVLRVSPPQLAGNIIYHSQVIE